jgi:hypothetical protein
MLDRRHTGVLRKRDNLLTQEGKGVGEEPKHTTAKKPVPLSIIQYSLGIGPRRDQATRKQEGNKQNTEPNMQLAKKVGSRGRGIEQVQKMTHF